MGKITNPLGRTPIPLPEQELVSTYTNDHGRYAIERLAAKYGVSGSTIRHHLKTLGVSFRVRSGASSGVWRGGIYVQGSSRSTVRYVVVLNPSHPRQRVGYVFEHILIVERALGYFLPRKHPTHHVDGDGTNNRNSNLVVCESESYHRLLHARARIIRMGGNPNLDKVCSTCQQVKPRGSFSNRRKSYDGLEFQCGDCHRTRNKVARAARKQLLPRYVGGTHAEH